MTIKVWTAINAAIMVRAVVREIHHSPELNAVNCYIMNIYTHLCVLYAYQFKPEADKFLGNLLSESFGSIMESFPFIKL